MKELIRKHLPFLRQEAQYAVICVDADEVRVSLVKAPEGVRHFEIIKAFGGIAGDLPKLLTRIKLRYTTKIIISLSHRYATTFRTGVKVQRNDAKAEVTEAELENVVSRGLWKLFNQERHAAAVKMHVADVAVKVSDADIVGVKLDGHRILDPLGFCAREVELHCQETLVVQPAIAGLLEMLPQEQIVSVQESPAAWPLLVCAEGSAKDFLALTVLATETVLYKYTHETLRCIDTFAWGGLDMLKAIGAFFGTSQSEAQMIINLYTAGNASRSVLKKVEAVFSQELSILFKGIEAHRLEHETSPIFIASSFKIPSTLMKRRYTILDRAWISEKLGYTLKSMESAEDIAPDDSVCAALSVYREQLTDTQLSKIAKRRARWL